MATYSVIANDGSTYGPVDEADLTQWAREGRLTAVTQVRCEPEGQVVQAGSLGFLASVLAAPAPVAVARPMVPMYAQVVPIGSPQAMMHQLTEFSVGLIVLLQFVTLGIFSLIWFGLMHDKMPKIRQDDPSAGKAIGFMFIPFFNLYWIFFAYMRLCDRIAEQRELRGLPAESLRGLAIATCIVGLIPYVGWCVGSLIMWPLFFGMLQSRVNELVQVTQQQIVQQQAVAATPFSGPGV
ncbi:MAG TPA: DUF4234 domain-containing protein [Phycisphaerae bacterium]|nr:DUF4234 domain-containing protein [Phycisphaerae bacterium]